MLRLIAAGLLVVGSVHHVRAATVDAIRKAGVLTCGIDQSEAEFSITDEHGSRAAFDHDLCNAVATAILGAPNRVALRGYPDEDTALQALQSGEVDMVATVSDDLSHSTAKGVALSRPILFDPEGFMVPRASGVASAKGLSGKKICFLGETQVEENVRAWFKRNHLRFVPFPFQEEGEMEAAFITGNCAALAGDRTRLANTRAAFGQHAKDFVLLPETLASDTLASAFRREEEAFGNVVNWTYEVLLRAEEEHTTARDVGAGHAVGDSALLDTAHALGRPLGLEDGWTVRVIQAVGNYGEMFRRDLGDASPLKLPRAENALQTNGGLMQSLPLK